jgi:hypothetical protein
MNLRRCAIILLLILPTGCTSPPAGRPQNAQKSELQKLAASIVPLGVPVRVGGAGFLTQPAVAFSRDGQPVPYREAEVPVSHGPAGLLFQLQPAYGNGPGIRYEIVESRGGTPVLVRFSSEAALPDISIEAAAPGGLLPVRLEAGGEGEVVHSAIGPAPFASCDGLYNPRQDRAVGIDRPFQYTPGEGPDKPGLIGIMMRSGGAHELGVTFRFHPDLLKSAFQFAPPAQEQRRPSEEAPATWCIMRPPGATDVAELEPWLKENLAFGGELVRLTPGGGVPELLCAKGAPNSGTPADGQARWRAWKKKLDKTRDTYSRVIERGENYNWQQVRELLAATVEDYWSHGIVGANAPGPLLIDAPLSLEHARLWVSLMGLSGQTVVLGDDLRKLPAERVELLRAILPPAPVRTLDLFAHKLPEQWVLTATRTWRTPENLVSIEPIIILGVFNLSLEPRRMPVRLADLMPALQILPGGGRPAFAVWDVWNRKLVAVARDTLSLPMRPASGRVFCIVPAANDRPSLIGAGRHIVQGQLELTELCWDPTQAAMSGTVDLPARDPYELRFLVPEGDKSFEIDETQAQGAAAQVSRDGPVRRVTLTADADGRVRWTVKLRPASQQLEAPAAPSGLGARQNTRGVLLTWPARDERAVLYRVYRDDKMLAESAEPEYQDSTAEYGRQYTYALAAVDYAGRESPQSEALTHRTPVPASTNLTDLVPLLAEQEHLAVMPDTSAAGHPLRVTGKRYHRGLGTHSNARIRYYLGNGYEKFTGEVGIDDETEGKGSAVFKIMADGRPLFTSPVMRGQATPVAFSVPVRGCTNLELIVTDAGDNPDNDHADWGNPYLEARVR